MRVLIAGKEDLSERFSANQIKPVLLAVSIILVWAACHYWRRMATADEPRPFEPRLLAWMAKGILVPVLVWLLLNGGSFSRLPPLLPGVRSTVSRRISVLFDTMPTLLFVVGSCWAAVTFAWLVGALVARTTKKNRGDFIGLTIVWSVMMSPLVVAVLYIGGWGAIGFAVAVWLMPIAHHGVPLAVSKNLPPTYSRAVAKMKLGKYNDAEWEVIQELEKRDDDFEGWMILAELYAKNFNDLAGAEQTIRDLCAQFNVTGSQISLALHRLADWHLEIREDPAAARQALEEISQRFPGTLLDRMARLRIGQLPASSQELRDRKQRKPIPVPRSEKSIQA